MRTIQSAVDVDILILGRRSIKWRQRSDITLVLTGILKHNSNKLTNNQQIGSFISRYRRIGYNLNVMRQSACLVFNPIMVDNYAAFFNCTPVGRASDSMMAPT